MDESVATRHFYSRLDTDRYGPHGPLYREKMNSVMRKMCNWPLTLSEVNADIDRWISPKDNDIRRNRPTALLLVLVTNPCLRLHVIIVDV